MAASVVTGVEKIIDILLKLYSYKRHSPPPAKPPANLGSSRLIVIYNPQNSILSQKEFSC